MLNLDELKFINKILKESESQDEMTLGLIEKINLQIFNAENCKECLWSFFWDCGRNGDVEGLFIANKEEVEEAIGQQVYFGEILGKHSEIYGELEKGDISLESDDPITVLNAIETGYNPLEYIKYTCSVCEDSYEKCEFDDFENKICNYCKEEKTE